MCENEVIKVGGKKIAKDRQDRKKNGFHNNYKRFRNFQLGLYRPSSYRFRPSLIRCYRFAGGILGG